MNKCIKDIAASIIAIAMAIFHLYTAGFGRFPSLQQRSIHLAFALSLIFLIYPARKNTKSKILSGFDISAIVFSILSCGNITFVVYYLLYERAGAATNIDIVLGSILILLILEMTRRIMGLALPIITVIFIAYAFLGPYIPIPYLKHAGVNLSRFISYEYLSTEGIFTIPLGVSATFIAVFVIFASFLIRSGVGNFFMEAATAVAGGMTGGPAKISVVASAAMGSISGSAVANVATTGSVTIPLMKKMGFPAVVAGGIEGTASTGGQIMPPLMGAAAFIIASITGNPYIRICVAALVPAVLSFLSVFIIVHFESERYGIKGLSRDQIPRLWPVLKKRGHLVLPVGVLVAMLLMGYTAMKAGFYSIASVVIVSALQRETRMGLRKILSALDEGARAVLPIVAACACSGIIVGVLTLTGLGLKISYLLVEIAGGNIPVLLILAMCVSIILGMGITTTAAYLLVAIIVAPALAKMGVPELAAHMFVFYFAVISTITPPVALAGYTAAAIAETDPFKTSLVGFRIGIAKFVVPYYLIYRPEIMLLFGNIQEIVMGLTASFVGIWALAVGACGYAFRELKWYERIFLLACIPFTIPTKPLWNVVAGGIIVGINLLFWTQARKTKTLLRGVHHEET